MQPGVMLIVSLATLYILAMGIFWHCLWGQKSQEPVGSCTPTLRIIPWLPKTR